MDQKFNDLDIISTYHGKRKQGDLESTIEPIEAERVQKSRHHKPLPAVPKSKSAASAKKSATKRKNNPDGTPLQRFKKQTVLKRKALKKARADIDRELKAIEKDLGRLKRK